MLCEPLVGRDGELAALQRRVEGLVDGHGGSVALVGHAGAGKSRLLAELVDRAQASGCVVLAGRAVPGASPVAHRPLTEAFLGAFRSGPPPDDPSLIGFHPHLARLVPAWSDGGAEPGAESSSVLFGEAIVRLLAVVAAAAPGGRAVLVVEDVHWADPETVAVLDYLVDALVGEPVLCVWTARPDGAADDLVERLGRRHPRAVVRVGPLEREDLDHMVAACLSAPVAPPVLSRFVQEHSDGVPFLVEELLAGLVASGELRLEDGRWTSAGSLTPAVPASLRSSIGRRLAGMDDTARRVIASAALLGRHFEWELVPGIAEVDGRSAVDALRAAVDEQLIEVEGTGFTFRHALTREAVLADLLPPERQALAARAWPAVERANPGLPGPTCELAADLAEMAGQRTAAALRLVESGRRALSAGAFVSAEAVARRARLLAAGDADAELDVDALLVDVLVAAGQPGEAIDLGQDLAARLDAAGAPDERRIDLLVTTATAAVAAGELDRATAALKAMRRMAADEARLARIDAVAAHVALDRAEIDAAASLATSAQTAAAATRQPAVECDALIVLGRIARSRDQLGSTSWFERAAAIAEEAGLGSWHLRARHELALSRWSIGESGAIDETRALAARYGALGTVAVMDLTIADMALSGFDREGCLVAATSCVEASRRYRLATESVASLWLAGAHALASDDVAMERAIAASLEPDPHDQRILGDLYGRVLATRALVRGELEALPALLDTMMEHVRVAPATTSVYPGRLMWVALHAADDEDLGVDQRAEFDEVVEQLRFPLFDLGRDMSEAVVLGRQGDAEAAAARFDPAYEYFAASPVGIGMTHCQALLVARAAIRDGWGDPVRWVRTAEAFFVEHDYPALVRRARRLLADAGAPVPRPGRGATEVPASLRALGVTSRELDVLVLVIDGRSNKEIAAELFLSTKTVERHLSSLFDRTGVRNRGALADLTAPHLPTHVGEPSG